MIAHDLWRRRFAGDAAVVGRRVELNGRPHTVIGVMPEGFSWPPATELWVPFVPETGMNRGYHLLQVVGRLKHGASIAATQDELSVIAAASAAAHPATNRDWGVQASSLLDATVGQADAIAVDSERRGRVPAVDRLRERGEPARRRARSRAGSSCRCARRSAPAAAASCSNC